MLVLIIMHYSMKIMASNAPNIRECESDPPFIIEPMEGSGKTPLTTPARRACIQLTLGPTHEGY